MPLTGREKATIFLSILGAETASRILRYLPEELGDVIAAGINHLPTPSPEALSEVMAEFQGFLALPEPRSRLEEKLPPPPVKKEDKPRVRRNYAILMYERPQMIAHLIRLMPEDQREEALNNLPRERALVEELLANLKPNSLFPKIAAQLKEQFQDKLF
jgi:flagellar motor switch protein FliG